jgi:hypothetical protein
VLRQYGALYAPQWNGIAGELRLMLEESTLS